MFRENFLPKVSILWTSLQTQSVVLNFPNIDIWTWHIHVHETVHRTWIRWKLGTLHVYSEHTWLYITYSHQLLTYRVFYLSIESFLFPSSLIDRTMYSLPTKYVATEVLHNFAKYFVEQSSERDMIPGLLLY